MNKNISVWRGDNTPPTQYHLWLKNNGKLYVNIDEKWQEIDKDSVAQITKTLNQHATKLDNHQTALNDINTLHSKLWTPGKGNFSVITQGTKNSIGDDESKGAIGDLSVAEGEKTTAKKTAAHAEGCLTVAEGFHSHAEGYSTRALGDDAHAEGSKTLASGLQAHAEGYDTRAIGNQAHAEGDGVYAYGRASHAEGSSTTANGIYSHAEGQNARAYGNASHAEGYLSMAAGQLSHAEGDNTEAKGYASHTEGYGTIASGRYSHAQGRYNVDNAMAIDSIGIGSWDKFRKNSEYTYLKQNNEGINKDSRNGYKYLIGIGGYDGVSTDVTTYKSLQEVISDIDSTLKVKADLVDGKIPLEQLGNLDMVLFEVVRELPTNNIKKHIYLMKVSELESGAKNLYAEYIYTGDITAVYDASKWEKLGVKQIETDLSNYYTKEETDSQIQAVKNKFPLQVASFTVSPSVYAVGTSLALLKWSYNNEDINPITSQSINDVSLDNNARMKIEHIISDVATTKTFTLKANSLIKTVTVYVVNKSYYGVVSADTTTVTNTTGLTAKTQYGAQTSIAFTQANQKIVYLYPSTFGDLTSIKDQNGFEGISGFDKQSITIDNVGYNLYISKIPATSNVTLTFK